MPVVLVRHTDAGPCYALPDGAVEPGELPQEAAVRDIREELCVDACILRLLSLNCCMPLCRLLPPSGLPTSSTQTSRRASRSRCDPYPLLLDRSRTSVRVLQ